MELQPLPPLPLIDGVFFVDNNLLEYFDTCDRSAEYRLLHQRIAAESKPALSFGGNIHLALEHRYRKLGPEVCDDATEQEMFAVMEKQFNDNPLPIEDHRNFSLACEIVARYNQKYRHEEFTMMSGPSGEPLIELPFAEELGTFGVKDLGVVRVMYSGRIDLPVWWPKGHVFNIDHKTTSIMSEGFFDEQRMSAQQLGYLWALRRLTGLRPEGFIINAIRVYKPLISGKESTSKVPYLQRERYYLQDHQLDEWEFNLRAKLGVFFQNYSNGYMPMRTKWCVGKYGRCPYYDICSLPPSSRNAMLYSNIYTQNKWSPLRQVEPTKP